MTTVYTIGSGNEDNTQKNGWVWPGNSITVALTSKLLPQTLVFLFMGTFYNVYNYGFLHYPCNSITHLVCLPGLLMKYWPQQAFGSISVQIHLTVRLARALPPCQEVISFSISGMSFPVMAMNPVLQALANLFPLRHLLPDLCRFGA